MQRQELISKLFENGILVTKDVLQSIDEGLTYEEILEKINSKNTQTKPNMTDTSTMQNQSLNNTISSVQIIKSYKDSKKSEITVDDFIAHYQVRLDYLTQMLRHHTELENLTSIRRVLEKRDSEKISIIGFVSDIYETKNGHLSFTIEDKTGKVRALVLKKDDKKDIYEFAQNIVLDDVVGICGTSSGGNDPIIFVDTISLPDIPNGMELKKGPVDEHIAFIGDLHIGAKKFLHEDWKRFISWINCESQNQVENEIAKKVKYLVVIGDIIEGVGWYPNQEHDLDIKPFRDQYKYATELLKQIRSDIQIIITPGNHDIMRLSEPQPAIYEELVPELSKMKNVHLVSSPSIINIGKTEYFEGFNLLLYHGYSFFYYINNVPSIRKSGGIDRIDLVMKFLLQRRHLAPAHTSTLYLPDRDRDELIIDTIPDFFVTGHVHKSVVEQYKHITLLNCSCFVDVTDYQKKQGMIPDLSKVAVTNLQTRQTVVLDFHVEK